MARSRVSVVPLDLEEPSVNLTPLIDVVFVILIMFIVIAPLLELDRIQLAEAPSGSNENISSVKESSPITIQVHPDNSIWFEGRLIPNDQLTSELKKAKQRFPQAIPQLVHDRRAFFGTYQIVKNSAEEAGFSQMEIILKPI